MKPFHRLRRRIFAALHGIALGLATPAFAGIADEPLPLFSDGKASVQVQAVSGLVKRTQLETEFLCTSFADVAVDIGVQVFDATGTLQNDIGNDEGVALNVAPGQTVTIATSATAALLESVVIPLTNLLQGSARVVASSPRVYCNVVWIDDTTTPPALLSTVPDSIQPSPGARPASAALPTFSNGISATHSAIIPGVAKRSRVETDVFCTSLASTPIQVGVQIFAPDGSIANSIAAGNGALLDVAPGATVTFGTTGTAALLESSVITLPGIAQGMARIVSNSSQLMCTAATLDAGVAPPVSSSGLAGAATTVSPAPLPAALPAFANGHASVAVLTAPGLVSRGRVQTDVFCTSLADVPVDIGVQMFDSAGTLQNNITTGTGALLNVAPGATVTFGSSGTAAYLESATVPLAAGFSHGVLRVVASDNRVRCNVVLLDNAVTPPASLATLGEGMRPAAGGRPTSLPLPQFADGVNATHAIELPGAVKRNRLEMAFFCTSLASSPVHLGVEIVSPAGVVGNQISTGNGALLSVAPGATVSLATTGTAAFLEDATISIAGVAQGMARIVSNSSLVSCNALVLDAAVTPPVAMTALYAAPVAAGPVGTPTPSQTPTVTATRTPTSTVTPTPSVTATPTVTPTASFTATWTPTPTNTASPTTTATRTATPTQTATFTPIAADHYKLYSAKLAAGTAPFEVPARMLVTDRFGSAWAQPFKPSGLANAATVAGSPVQKPAAHLQCHPMKVVVADPPQPEFAGRRVDVSNQFGTLSLELTEAKKLCVVASSDATAPPSPPVPETNNYQCYKVKSVPGAPRFTRATVTVADELETKLMEIRPPFWVCTPAGIDGTATLEPAVDLTCYRLKDARTDPRQPKLTAQNTYTASHYGSQQTQITKAKELCVPSLLVDWGAIP